MTERAPFGFLVQGLRITGFDEAAAPNGRQAIAFRLSDGSHLLAYADDDPGNTTGIKLEWIPAHWT